MKTLSTIHREVVTTPTTSAIATPVSAGVDTYIDNNLVNAIYGKFFEAVQVTNEKTAKAYRNALRQFATYAEDKGLTVGNIQRTDLVTWQRFLINGNEVHLAKAPATINAYMTAIKLFFRFLYSEGAIKKDITLNIKNVRKVEGHSHDYFTASQIKDILADDGLTLRNKAILALMFACGLRTIEVRRANIEDIQTKGGQTVIYIQGKGRKDKKEFQILHPAVEKILRKYLATRTDRSDGSAPLFVASSHNYKGRLSTDTISKMAKDTFKRCGFNSSRLTAHSTRSSAIMLAVHGGEDIEAIKAFARHKDISTTMIYIHEDDRILSTVDKTIANQIF